MAGFKYKYIRFIRIISIAVLCLFTINNIAWANPDFFQRGTGTQHLQPALLSWATPDRAYLEFSMSAYLDSFNVPVNKLKLHLFPIIKGKRVDLHFDRKIITGNEWLVPCSVDDKKFNVFVDSKDNSIRIESGKTEKPVAQTEFPGIEEKTERLLLSMLSLGHNAGLLDVVEPAVTVASAFQMMTLDAIGGVNAPEYVDIAGKAFIVTQRFQNLLSTLDYSLRRKGTLSFDDTVAFFTELKDVNKAIYGLKKELLVKSGKHPLAVEPNSPEDMMEMAVRNMDMAMSIIENRIAFARGELEFKPVALDQIVRGLFDNKKFARYLKTDGEIHAASVSGDERSLESVLNNIINNGIYFAKKKNDAEAKLKISLIKENGQAKIVISDNGEGISTDMLEVDPSTGRPRLFLLRATGRSDGTGVGLAEAWYTVKDCGGSIHAENIEGGGARFTILLPLDDDKTGALDKVSDHEDERARFGALGQTKESVRTMQEFGKLVAIAFLPFAFFVFLIAAPIIKLTSPGSIFYKQRRLGERGKPITIWKLRTMTTEADPAERKVTFFGKLVRLPGFDELPQLFSIIRGDMQWFGPRPYKPDEIDQNYIDEVLHGIKPGLFSLRALKVHGKGWQRDTNIPKKETDLEYLSKKSWLYDTELAIKTLLFVHFWGLVKRLVVAFSGKRKDTPRVKPESPDMAKKKPEILDMQNPETFERTGIHVVPVSGTKLHCRTMGRDNAPAIIIVHGGPGFDHNYLLASKEGAVNPFLQLAKKYRLIFYDQRASGESGGREDLSSITVNTFVNDIEGIRKAFGLDKVHLMGHSWGGLLAALYAARNPDKARSLTLFHPLPENNSKLRESSIKRSELWKADGFNEKYTDQTDYWERFFTPYFYRRENVREIGRFLHPRIKKDMKALFKRLRRFLMSYDITEELAQIACPGIIISGEHDFVSVRGLGEIMDNVEMYEMQKCAHFSFFESPDEFFNIVSAFLEEAGGEDPVAGAKDTEKVDREPGLGQILERIRGAGKKILSDPDLYASAYKDLRDTWRRYGVLPATSAELMSLIYSPGVGTIASMVHENKELFHEYVGSGASVKELDEGVIAIERDKSNPLWIVTDGSAVLGLGNIGELAGAPVMEGKQVLMKWFGKVEANILLVDTSEESKGAASKVAQRIKYAIRKMQNIYGRRLIMLEDIRAPECFVAEKLLNESGIPTIHDDQHGTAVIITASVINALREARKKPEGSRIVIEGAGASGIAVARLLHSVGVKEIICFDSKGAIYVERDGLNAEKKIVAQFNASVYSGDIAGALSGADGYIGLCRPKLHWGSEDMLKNMNPRSFVFACSNPQPEFDIERILDIKKRGGLSNIAFLGCGRYGIPGPVSTINNCYVFPGFYRALVDLFEEGELPEGLSYEDIVAMCREAALAISSLASEKELENGLILPRTFTEEDYNGRITEVVANAVYKHFTGIQGRYEGFADMISREHAEQASIVPAPYHKRTGHAAGASDERKATSDDEKPEAPDMAREKKGARQRLIAVTVLGKKHRVKRAIWDNITPAVPDDAEAIFKLSQMIPTDGDRGVQPDVEITRALIRHGASMNSRPLIHMVYREQMAVKGYILAEVIPKTGMVKILQTAVDTSCRGRGIGTVLSAKLISECEKKGLRKFIRRPVHPATQKVARRFKFVPIQGEEVPTLIANFGYYGLNTDIKDVAREVMEERLAGDVTGLVEAIGERDEKTVKFAIYDLISSLWIEANRIHLPQERYEEAHKRVLRMMPELSWLPEVFEMNEIARVLEMLAPVVLKDIPWVSFDDIPLSKNFNPQEDLIKAGVRYWTDGEKMREEVFEAFKQGNIIPLVRYRYLKALNDGEQMGKIEGGVVIENTKGGISLTRGEETLLCTHEMINDYMNEGKQPGDETQDTKPEAPDMAREKKPGDDVPSKAEGESTSAKEEPPWLVQAKKLLELTEAKFNLAGSLDDNDFAVRELGEAIKYCNEAIDVLEKDAKLPSPYMPLPPSVSQVQKEGISIRRKLKELRKLAYLNIRTIRNEEQAAVLVARGATEQEFLEKSNEAVHDILSRYRMVESYAFALENLMHSMPEQIGRRFQGHGIKDGFSSIQAIVRLLRDGVDRSREFYSMPMYDLTGYAGAFGAPYPFTSGGIVLVSPVDEGLAPSDPGEKMLNVKYVVLGEVYYTAIPYLQKIFPDIRFLRANEAQGVFIEDARKAAQTGPVKPAAEVNDERRTTKGNLKPRTWRGKRTPPTRMTSI